MSSLGIGGMGMGFQLGGIGSMGLGCIFNIIIKIINHIVVGLAGRT